MPRTIEYWWICNDMQTFGLENFDLNRSSGSLYQCVMGAGLFEAAGRGVKIGLYDPGRTVIYQTGSTNSKINCVHRHPTFNEHDNIDCIALASEYFSYLTDRDQHNDGYWELLDSYHYFRRGLSLSAESIINFEFIWHRDGRPRTKLKTEEEVNWMKEGF